MLNWMYIVCKICLPDLLISCSILTIYNFLNRISVFIDFPKDLFSGTKFINTDVHNKILFNVSVKVYEVEYTLV